MDAFADFDQTLAELESVIGALREEFPLEVEIEKLVREQITIPYRISWLRKRHKKTSHIYRYVAKHKLCELAAA